MYAWAVKRRIIYGGIVLLFFAIIFGLVFWKYLYKAPTCTDSIKNGDEKGIDCGGSCKNLCTSDTLSPAIHWAKIFNISGDYYTAVAYVQNPNLTSVNPKATYKFRIYDDNRNLLSEKSGFTSIPKNKMFAVFETNLVFTGRKPKYVDFEFVQFSPWQKDTEKDPDLDITYGSLESTSTSPRITGTVTNSSTKSISQLELDVFVMDSKENVVAASRSFVDNLAKGTSQDFVFTWPRPFNLGVEACLTPLDVVVSLDRSGSMRSESKDPPEPFNTVLSTAQNFIKNLMLDDQAGVVSFGNISRVENELSTNKDSSVRAVSSMSLGTTSEQTNIAAGLTDAYNILTSDYARNNAKKVIILLTDGVPTEPKQDGVKDYPIISAEQIADEIKSKSIEIYTIGLGKDLNEGFMKTISTDDGHYFNAPKKEVLSEIYKTIGTGLCQKKPNVITVISRPL
jgi:hypothetical protein